jgi:hypothetical protein
MSVEFTGALIKEQGVEFMVVLVKKSLIDNIIQREKAIINYQRLFGVTSVLASQDYRGNLEYFGREDISNFLSNIHPSRIPWSKFKYG